jgi:hypothetical protein
MKSLLLWSSNNCVLYSFPSLFWNCSIFAKVFLVSCGI